MTVRSRLPIYWMRVWLLSVFPLAAISHAAADDPGAHQVQILDDALLKSMRAGSNASITDRYQMLESVIEGIFDLPLMTRLSVGPAWTTFSAEQQQAVVTAFTRLTIAGYAHNFQKFAGEKFAIDDNITSRGADKIIQARITSEHDAPANLIYRARQSGATWRLIDVYYDGISQLTMHRSDFGAAIAGGGAAGLIAHLNSLTDGFMKR